MSTSINAQWILRIATAGTFIGHGVFALEAKKSWFVYFSSFGITDEKTITTLLLLIGIADLLLAIHILVRPVRALVLWMAFWGLWTALVRWPFGPDPLWDFVERWANWGSPLSLLLLMGWPRKSGEWWK
ncbi:hypothetical protein HYV73_02255 [Candidatus Uhrbacteria bacterium]|nr:hypothetical protein [Candidatus Uhrbacteria bacterium]